MSTPLSFNANWYLSQNPDVAAAIQAGAPFNAFEHFTLYGRAENRSASPVFDAQEYLRNNPDVAEAVAQGLITAWDHFELFGGAEGRSPTPLFNEAFYLQQNPDVAAAIEQGIISSAAQHFALFGQSEPRAINPAINLGQYLSANPDIAQAAANGLINPLDHLMQYGVTEGRPLGNGVSLSDFASDPGFTQALTGGNPVQALIRVESVAPFLPTFERPAGWVPPANTPIPVDFVPPADSGIKLVVPPEVVVPDDVELPETFEPVEPGPTPVPPGGGGTLPDPVDIPTRHTPPSEVAEVAQDNGQLWVGGGNSAGNFSVTTTSLSQLELALKGYIRSTGDTAPPTVNGTDNPTYVFRSNEAAGFAYSLASLNGVELSQKISEGYSFFLKIDTDNTRESNYVVLKLDAKETNAPPAKEGLQDSGYKWLRLDENGNVITSNENLHILDDEGHAGLVTQNIQTPYWYGENLQIGSNLLKGGYYDVALEVKKGGHTVVEHGIQLNVLDVQVTTLSDFALTAKSTMINGENNPGTDFAVHQIDLADENSYLEIALGGQQRHGPNVYTPEVGTGIITVPQGEVPVFKFSVGTNSESTLKDLLNTYDIKLLVDTDPGAGTEFIELRGTADTDNSSGALDWEFTDEKYKTYKLIDDAGTEKVSQNIQALGWYQPDSNGELFTGLTIDPGHYTVALEVYSKDDSIQLVGATQVTFEIQAEAS